MSGRHSYGGPSDSHVLMNPMPPSTTSSRNVNGAAGGGKAVASKNKGNGGGIGARHSHGSNSTVAPTPAPQQPHQQYPPNNHYHQRPTPQDMVVENIPNSIMTNNNNNPTHYTQHIPPPVHQNPPPTNTRKKTQVRTSNIQEIISIDSDPDDNANNNANNAVPAPGPSLAGPASRNRSLLNGGHYDPVRPNRASASPSISFLTDPQPTPSQQQQQPVPSPPVFRKPAEKPVVPPIIKPDIDSPPIAASIKVATSSVAPVPPPPVREHSEKPAKPEKAAKETTKETAGQRSPKATKTKKSSTAVSASVPKATGNGLLSGLPGVDVLGDNGDQIEIPTIYIHVPLNGETNKYVNFAKLAEEKYGAFAVNPRAHRERMRMDISGDEDSESSGSAMEDRRQSGMEGGESTADNKPKKRAKRKQYDNYDAGDPFIDDSEMLYEEQAAATKDGFFVYSGPLIPQGEKVHVERADGTVSKRGRGGGRGRGGSRGGGGAAKAATTRKPRQTKKQKEQALKEAAAERERAAAVAAGAATGH